MVKLAGRPGRLAHRLAAEVRGFSIGLGSSLKRLEVGEEQAKELTSRAE